MAKYAIVVCNENNEPVDFLGLSNRAEVKLTNEYGDVVGTLGNYEIPSDEVAIKIFESEMKKTPISNGLIMYKLCKGEQVLSEVWK